MEIKDTVLEMLERSNEHIQTLLESLTDEERARIGTYEKWAIKDQIAHIEAWKAYLADNIFAVLEGTKPSRSDDFEQANQEIFENYRESPIEEIAKYAQGVQKRLVALVGKLSEEDILKGDFLPWQDGREFWRQIVGTAYTHPVSHLGQIYIDRDQIDRATELQEEAYQLLSSLDDSPSWRGVLIYNLACHYSLSGEKKKAVSGLREALQLNPELVDWSKQDPDFAAIREEPEYLALYEG